MRNLKKLDLLQTTVLTGMLFMVAPAFAQDAVDTVPEAVAEVEDNEDTITITGSRIERPGIDTGIPITSVDVETFENRAFTNLAQGLAEIPQFGAAIDGNGEVNNFTAGQNFVNLLDLGTQRTLTLVNGRRFVSTNVPSTFGSASGLQVDLNVIPISLTERVEVVPILGAAVYGSDAIAGTVNVVLRDDFEGFDVSAQYGQTEEDDGLTYQMQAVAGANIFDDRGNVAFAVEYNKQEGLLQTDRPRYTENNPYFLNYGTSTPGCGDAGVDFDGDGSIDSRSCIAFGQRVQLLSAGGSLSVPPQFFAPSTSSGPGSRGALADGNFYQFAPNGNLEPCQPGVTPAGSIFFANGGTCGEDFFDQVVQLRSPIERTLIASTAHFDFTDNVRYVQEVMFANTNSARLVAQGGFQSFPFGGTSAPATFTTDNPFLNDQALGVLNANNLTSFNVNRFNNDLLQSGSTTENHVFRYVGGLEGQFEALGRDWSWDVSMVRGEGDVEIQTFGIIDGRFFNAIDAVEVNDDYLDELIANDMTGGITDRESALAALQGIGNTGPVVDGSIICRVVGDDATGNLSGFNENASGNGITDADLPFVNGCAPLNLFGQGAASPEALAFINGGPRISSTDTGQTVYQANFAGSLFNLPAGPIQFNVGTEFRKEEAQFTSPLGGQVPLTRSSVIPTGGGEIATAELYGELLVPLISPDMNNPFGSLLEFELAYRDVSSETQGFNDIAGSNRVEQTVDDDVYTVNGRYKPIDDLTLRGTYAEAFRTPSLVELFSPLIQTFTSGTDPCDNRFVGEGQRPDVRRANCIADGISDPDTFTSNITNATIPGGQTGGNSNLISERSESYSLGFVYEPSYLDGFVMTVDYFNVEIEDAITGFDFELAAQTCYDATDFPNNAACDLFERDPVTNQVISTLEGPVNAAIFTYEGYTAGVQYDFELANFAGIASESMKSRDLGDVSLRLNLVHDVTSETQATADTPPEEDVGDFGDPSWQGTFDTTWTKGPLQVFHRLEYQNAAKLSAAGDRFFLDQDFNQVTETDARYINNLSVRYEVNDNVRVQFNVDNLLDREPDLVQEAAGHFGIDELLGRRFTVGARASF